MKLADTIKICNEFGEEKEFLLLFTFDYKYDGEKYIVYADKKDEKYEIFCSLHRKEDNGLWFVEPVKNEQVLRAVDSYIKDYFDKVQDNGIVLYNFITDEEF